MNKWPWNRKDSFETELQLWLFLKKIKSPGPTQLLNMFFFFISQFKRLFCFLIVVPNIYVGENENDWYNSNWLKFEKGQHMFFNLHGKSSNPTVLAFVGMYLLKNSALPQTQRGKLMKRGALCDRVFWNLSVAFDAEILLLVPLYFSPAGQPFFVCLSFRWWRLRIQTRTYAHIVATSRLLPSSTGQEVQWDRMIIIGNPNHLVGYRAE